MSNGEPMNKSITARLGAIAAATAAIAAFGAGPAMASANSGCGSYCPSGVGQPSGNGNATNQPAAGTKGKADYKNPPGQYPDGSDDNKGYECDDNQGVGKTNPAHSGCDTGSGSGSY
jgi:hypothetical protein